MELTKLAELFELSDHLIAGALVLARIGPLVWLTPFLGGPALSKALRVVVALALSLVFIPSVSTSLPDGLSEGTLFVLLLKESVIGTALGLLAAVAFHTFAMAGQLMDQARGAITSHVVSPLSGELSSPLGSLSLLVAVALFLLIGGHHAFLSAIAGSYEVIPAHEIPVSPGGLRPVALVMARLVASAISAAFMLAAPAFAAIVLTEIGLGVLGRTAPQLGSYFMSLPLRATIGLIGALLALSFAVGEMMPLAQDTMSLVSRVVDLLAAQK